MGKPGNEAEAVGAAIEGEVGFEVTDCFWEGEELLGGDVGEVCEDEGGGVWGERVEEVILAEGDGEVEAGGVQAGEGEGVWGEVGGGDVGGGEGGFDGAGEATGAGTDVDDVGVLAGVVAEPIDGGKCEQFGFGAWDECGWGAAEGHAHEVGFADDVLDGFVCEEAGEVLVEGGGLVGGGAGIEEGVCAGEGFLVEEEGDEPAEFAGGVIDVGAVELFECAGAEGAPGYFFIFGHGDCICQGLANFR